MNLTPEDRDVGRNNYYDVLTDYDRQTYHRHRRGFLKQVIAAGGLRVTDVDPWLKAGHAAVALGRRVIDVQGPDPALLRWLQTTSG